MEAEEEEEAVDLTSPDFDPTKALFSRAVNIPVPNVRPFENLAQYESAMKGRRAPRKAPSSAQTSGTDSAGSATEAGPSARSLPPLVATHRKPAKTLLTRMKETKQGPLEVLRKCIHEKRRVMVTTRTFKGLRGICMGYLVAFDKFWNLAMADVEEVYHKPPLGKLFFNEETLTVSKLLQSEKTSQIVTKKDLSMQSIQRRETCGERQSVVGPGEETTPCSTQYKGQGAGVNLQGNIKSKQMGSASGYAELSTRTESTKRSDRTSHRKQSREKEKSHTKDYRTDRPTSSKDRSIKRQGKERDKSSKADAEDMTMLEDKLAKLQRELATLEAEESDHGVGTVQSSTGPCNTPAEKPSHGEGAQTKSVKKHTSRKQQSQFFKRHVNQLFVRGENVVLVSIKDA